MPTQPKVNPTHADIGRSFNGKTVQAYTVNLGADLTNELGPNGAVQEVLFNLALRVTPVLIGELSGTTPANGSFTYYVEGEFPTDDYNDDGTPVAFDAHLQAEIRALGTVGVRDAALAAQTGETVSAGIDLSTTPTVTAGETFYADQIPA